MFKIFGIDNDDKETIIEQQGFNDTEDKGQIALDIVETPENITIISPIAGVDLENIDISLDENILTISGKRNLPELFSYKNIIIRNSECFWGNFSRTIILPENLDLDSIKATLEKGILYIIIKKIKFASQTIKVEAKA